MNPYELKTKLMRLHMSSGMNDNTNAHARVIEKISTRSFNNYAEYKAYCSKVGVIDYEVTGTKYFRSLSM